MFNRILASSQWSSANVLDYQQNTGAMTPDSPRSSVGTPMFSRSMILPTNEEHDPHSPVDKHHFSDDDNTPQHSSHSHSHSRMHMHTHTDMKTFETSDDDDLHTDNDDDDNDENMTTDTNTILSHVSPQEIAQQRIPSIETFLENVDSLSVVSEDRPQSGDGSDSPPIFPRRRRHSASVDLRRQRMSTKRHSQRLIRGYSLPQHTMSTQHLFNNRSGIESNRKEEITRAVKEVSDKRMKEFSDKWLSEMDSKIKLLETRMEATLRSQREKFDSELSVERQKSNDLLSKLESIMVAQTQQQQSESQLMEAEHSLSSATPPTHAGDAQQHDDHDLNHRRLSVCESLTAQDAVLDGGKRKGCVVFGCALW